MEKDSKMWTQRGLQPSVQTPSSLRSTAKWQKGLQVWSYWAVIPGRGVFFLFFLLVVSCCVLHLKFSCFNILLQCSIKPLFCVVYSTPHVYCLLCFYLELWKRCSCLSGTIRKLFRVFVTILLILFSNFQTVHIQVTEMQICFVNGEVKHMKMLLL